MLNTLCYYVGPINLQVIYIEKYNSLNQVEIFIEISPANLPFWDTVDFGQMVTLADTTGL